MKKLFVFYIFFILNFASAQTVAINADGSPANESAILDLSSTTKGFLLPRMSAAQRDALLNPVSGLQVWCTNCGPNGGVQVFNGTSWIFNTVGAAGAQGPRGVEGISTTVNGVTQINGNITLTKENIGLGLANNTSDIDKPISIKAATAISVLQAQITNLRTVNHPKLTTTVPSAIDQITANTGGNITSEGPSPAKVTARGVCWSTSSGPTIALETKTVNDAGLGIFITTITGLTNSTTYYVRAYATNSFGTGYGNELSFTTAPNTPLLTTTALTSITANAVNSGGTISYAGASAITARGVCWSTSAAPTVDVDAKTADGLGTGSFTSSVQELNENTLYYIRAYATNTYGTSYGNELSFRTPKIVVAPIVDNTTAVTLITTTTATSGGSISFDGYGVVVTRGVCWSTSPNPTISSNFITISGSGDGTFVSNLTELTSNTIYYIRAFATNSFATAYGPEVSFSTLVNSSYAPLTSVTIGSQVWQKNNLDVGTYSDGTVIPQVSDWGTWIASKTGAWVYYANTVGNNTTYGKLYNWYAVAGIHNAASLTNAILRKKLAPSGWHIPSDAEWTTCITTIGNLSDAGGKMKSTGTTLWTTPNTAASDSSGFSGLPGGNRQESTLTSANGYVTIKTAGTWWTITASPSVSTDAIVRSMSYNTAAVTVANKPKLNGYSVRCVRD